MLNSEKIKRVVFIPEGISQSVSWSVAFKPGTHWPVADTGGCIPSKQHVPLFNQQVVMRVINARA